MIKLIPQEPVADILNGNRLEVSVLDKGFVALVDLMPRMVPEGQTADMAIVRAARVSYQNGTKTKRQDKSLIRYLLRHQHTSPVEMVELTWHMKLPIFVARHLVRHRTASLNEASARYSIVGAEFWRPESVRSQSNYNKQGSEKLTDPELLEAFNNYLQEGERQYNSYEVLMDSGLARELARTGLPINLYTEWYFKMDLRNTLHLLYLRADSHSQAETQAYAKAMIEVLDTIVPITMEAFRDYMQGSITFTTPELEALRHPKENWRAFLSGGEIKELVDKWEEFSNQTGVEQNEAFCTQNPD